jgi:hypothetical protein
MMTTTAEPNNVVTCPAGSGHVDELGGGTMALFFDFEHNRCTEVWAPMYPSAPWNPQCECFANHKERGQDGHIGVSIMGNARIVLEWTGGSIAVPF